MNGTSILVCVGIALVILKLAGIEPIAGLSWLVVTAPLWASALMAALVAMVYFGAYALVRLIEHCRYRR